MRNILFNLILFTVTSCFAQKTGVTVVSYNCENLFDCRHDSLKNDKEFLPEGDHHWTRGRYWKKVNDIGRVILSCGGQDKEWRLPDIVGLVEVENDSVLLRLIRGSVLREAGYRYIMTNSMDRRGVDVALLYNPLTVRLINTDTMRVTPMKGQRPTRDILHAELELRSGDTINVFVVHAPSRAGGQSATDDYRVAVMKKVLESFRKFQKVSRGGSKAIVMGDFNDYSYNKSLKYLKANGLADISEKAVGLYHPDEVTGTYYYQKRWESLDHIFLSPSLLSHKKACYIQDKEWMLEKDKNGRRKPYRTYLGTFYHGGVSDHLPLVLKLEFQ